MARARTLKPGFFKNEELVAMDPLVRLLFQGLWVLADRNGRLEDRPLRIKMEILPNDAIDADAALDRLAAAGLIRRYDAGGSRYIQVKTFGKHQSPHPKEPALHPPDPADQRPATDSTAPENDEQVAGNLLASGEPLSGQARPSHVSRPSRPSQPSHSLGETGGGGGEAPRAGARGAAPEPAPPPPPPEPTAVRSKRPTPLPAGWLPDEGLRAWAAEKGLTPRRIEHETEKFVARYRQNDERRGDWGEAWKLWMLRADEGPAGAPAANGRASPNEPPVRGGGLSPRELIALSERYREQGL